MSIFAMLNPLIGGALAIKGIEKLDPTMKKFIGYGTAAGYGTDQILDFLRSKAESEGYSGLKKKLGESEAEGTLRPDEAASMQRLKHAELPANIAQGALSTAAGAVGGALGAGIPLGKVPKAPSSDIQGGEMGPFQGQMGPMQGFMGPEEQGPQQGQMGPLRQGKEKPSLKQNLMQNLTPMQKEAGVIPKTREEAIKQYNATQKEKQEYKRLHEKYGEFYGGQQGQGGQQQGLSDEQILAAMQNIFKM